jgi:hypothetical protein
MELEGSQSGIPGSGQLHQQQKDSKSKRESAFARQRIVGTGLVRNSASTVFLSALDGRAWIRSPVKLCSRIFGRVSVVAFERDSRLESIFESEFREIGLRSITVPSSVVVLGPSSFQECQSLHWVFFESGSRLERIEESAFYKSGLKSIVIPSSVVVLGKSSFSWCELLLSVVFENDSRLERIEESVFYKSGLKSLVIPPRIAFIDNSVFRNVFRVSVRPSPDNGRLRLRDRFLENRDGSIIYIYLGACRSVVLPSWVVVLGKESFSGRPSLESVAFERGSRLERIEELAFCGSGLLRIVIPSSVVVLGRSSFSLCKSLDSVMLEDGSRLERIEETAFSESKLKSIAIPSSLVVLGKASFSLCPSLESVVIQGHSRLERIEESVFERSGLKSIAIPHSVTSVDRSAFDDTQVRHHQSCHVA